MIVSDSHRFIFVHVPKTAGKSISAALAPYGNPRAQHPLHIHEGLDEFLRRRRKEGNRPRLGLVKRPNRDGSLPYGNYRSFAFVRNPWERAVSAYSYIKTIGIAGAEAAGSFGEFVAHLDEGRHYLRTVHVARPQLDFITDYRGRIAVDRIGRFETLAEDFRSICADFGITVALEERNRSDHGPWRDYYDAQSRSVIARIYGADATAFGYTFDETSPARVAAGGG